MQDVEIRGIDCVDSIDQYRRVFCFSIPSKLEPTNLILPKMPNEDPKNDRSMNGLMTFANWAYSADPGHQERKFISPRDVQKVSKMILFCELSLFCRPWTSGTEIHLPSWCPDLDQSNSKEKFSQKSGQVYPIYVEILAKMILFQTPPKSFEP